MFQKFYWHAYHNKVISVCNGFERKRTIKRYKLLKERPLRLLLLKQVEAKLPKCLRKSFKLMEDIPQEYLSFVKELHRRECGCECWDWEQNQIKF